MRPAEYEVCWHGATWRQFVSPRDPQGWGRTIQLALRRNLPRVAEMVVSVGDQTTIYWVRNHTSCATYGGKSNRRLLYESRRIWDASKQFWSPWRGGWSK